MAVDEKSHRAIAAAFTQQQDIWTKSRLSVTVVYTESPCCWRVLVVDVVTDYCLPKHEHLQQQRVVPSAEPQFLRNIKILAPPEVTPIALTPRLVYN